MDRLLAFRGPTHPTMLSCLSSFSNEISRMAVDGTPSSSCSSRMRFRATTLSVVLLRALYTTPYVPSPIFSSFSKLSIEAGALRTGGGGGAAAAPPPPPPAVAGAADMPDDRHVNRSIVHGGQPTLMCSLAVTPVASPQGVSDMDDRTSTPTTCAGITDSACSGWALLVSFRGRLGGTTAGIRLTHHSRLIICMKYFLKKSRQIGIIGPRVSRGRWHPLPRSSDFVV